MNTDRFYGEAVEPPVVMKCEYGGCGIYDGEEYYEIDGMKMCDDCAWKYAKAKFLCEAKRKTAGE